MCIPSSKSPKSRSSADIKVKYQGQIFFTHTKKTFDTGHLHLHVSDKAFKFHMCILCIETFSFVPHYRSQGHLFKPMSKYQGNIFQKNGHYNGISISQRQFVC